jgi:uncharacterized membrane protein
MRKPGPSRLAALIGLTLLSLAAFLLRTPQLDMQSLWRDEVDVIRLADQTLPRLIRGMAQMQHNGPLYYLLMRGWLGLTGRSEFALRYFALCFGMLSVPLMYQVGKRLASRRAGLLAATVAAISPHLVWYSQDAKMYALVMALTLFAVICQLRALVIGKVYWWVAFVLAASLSLYTHMLSALMIPVYLGTLWLFWPYDRRQRWMGGAALGLLTLPYLPLVAWQLPLVLQPHDTGHPFYPMPRMLSLLFNLYTRGTAMVGDWPVVAAFLFALFVNIVSSMEGQRTDRRLKESLSSRPQVFLLLWLLAPVVLIYLISLRTPVFEPRYLIFASPAFNLLVAFGLIILSRLSRPAAGLTLAVILSFSLLGIWVQGTFPIKSDFRAAASYIKTHRMDQSPIMFQIPYVRYTFDYYFDGDYAALDGPWTNDGKSETDVADAMAQLLEDYSDVWLVVSESWLWDSRGLTQAWLNRYARLTGYASFTLVEVYHYELTSAR